MKLVSILIILLFIASSTLAPLAAQSRSTTSSASSSASSSAEADQPVIRDVEGLRIKLVQQVQDPGSKDIRYDMVIFSQFTSDRVQVTWDVQGGAEIISPTDKKALLTVKDNGIQTTSAVIRPRVEKSTVQLQVRVEAFEAQGTYVATAAKSFGILEGLVIAPTPSQYQIATAIYIGRTVTIAVLVMVLLAAAAYFGSLRFREWLNKR